MFYFLYFHTLTNSAIKERKHGKQQKIIFARNTTNRKYLQAMQACFFTEFGND